MSGENYAGNIITNLASLPDFLRTPILKKRVAEFYTLDAAEKDLIVNNALEAGPDIPFPNFAKLLRTWLEVMAQMPEEQKIELFGAYAAKAAKNPQSLARFHLDGMLEVFCSLPPDAKKSIATAASAAIRGIGDDERRKILLLIPDGVKEELGL